MLCFHSEAIMSIAIFCTSKLSLAIVWTIMCTTLPLAVATSWAPMRQYFSSQPPANPARVASTMEWCDCATGGQHVTVWPKGNRSASVNVNADDGAPIWISWGYPVSTVEWICDGMNDTTGESQLGTAEPVWSLQQSVAEKNFPCNKASGRLKLVSWQQASYNTSIVFSSGESGYECMKIPVLLRTKKGTLLAFAEARKNSCSDFAWTDLVLKTSKDNGASWSALRVVRSESGPGLPHTVIGNAAPVQLYALSGTQGIVNGRILLPHTRNNSDVWLMHSDDDGETWNTPRLLPNTTLPTWHWIGTGPPGSIQLKHPGTAYTGRIVVPIYHGPLRGNLANNVVHGSTLLSDDGGVTWHIGSPNGFGAADKFSNENQAVELANGTVLINARSLADPGAKQFRIQTLSEDGGTTFGPTRYATQLPQPIGGCEGSTVASPYNDHSLFFSGPNSKALRTGMTLWYSDTDGAEWSVVKQLDSGASGYSSLQVGACETAALGCDTVHLLYEQSDKAELVMNPDRFVFRRLQHQNAFARRKT
eukprot:m.1348750 g.1348750  ORF g.1348750 m.1348750 type:complete len:534 (-) comp24915_c1_seq10:3981-5582(-)